MTTQTNTEKLAKQFKLIQKKAKSDGIPETTLRSVLSQTYASLSSDHKKFRITPRAVWVAVISLCVVLFAVGFYETMDPRCLIGNNLLMLELSRPAVSCDVCKSMTEVPTVNGDDMTRELFMEKYAYNGIPLLIKGGAKNWTALYIFSFEYLKNLYIGTPGSLDSIQFDCQFFPYKTEFLSMAEVFNMSEARSRIEDGEKQWYVGWSNCHPEVAKHLRMHYQRPSFLPEGSETSNLDWLFMGGFGPGAEVHIDYVQRPSWQAMIAGKKSWKLIPSPECDNVCQPLNATMEKGDIILVDTNMWYHSTYIHPGEVSITIGSEYD